MNDMANAFLKAAQEKQLKSQSDKESEESKIEIPASDLKVKIVDKTVYIEASLLNFPMKTKKNKNIVIGARSKGYQKIQMIDEKGNEGTATLSLFLFV
jgi:hypothetical protein